MRGRAVFHAMPFIDVLRTRYVVTTAANEENKITFTTKSHRHLVIDAVQNTYHANGWCRIYGTVRPLVIKAHIATCNGSIEFPAGFSHAFYGVNELKINFRIIEIAK